MGGPCVSEAGCMAGARQEVLDTHNLCPAEPSLRSALGTPPLPAQSRGLRHGPWRPEPCQTLGSQKGEGPRQAASVPWPQSVLAAPWAVQGHCPLSSPHMAWTPHCPPERPGMAMQELPLTLCPGQSLPDHGGCLSPCIPAGGGHRCPQAGPAEEVTQGGSVSQWPLGSGGTRLHSL